MAATGDGSSPQRALPTPWGIVGELPTTQGSFTLEHFRCFISERH